MKSSSSSSFFKPNNSWAISALSALIILLFMVVMGFNIDNWVNEDPGCSVYKVIETSNGSYQFGFWFGYFSYFTVHSNYLCFILAILLLVSILYKPLLRSGYFFIFTTAYITVTFLLWNGLLLPTDKDISGHAADWWVINVCEHMLIPLLTIGTFVLYVVQGNTLKAPSLKKSLLFGMIYPIIYVIYCILAPFLSGDAQWSEYGSFTNLNPNFMFNGKTGNPVNVVIFLGALILFFVLLTVYTFLFQKSTNHKLHFWKVYLPQEVKTPLWPRKK